MSRALDKRVVSERYCVVNVVHFGNLRVFECDSWRDEIISGLLTKTVRLSTRNTSYRDTSLIRSTQPVKKDPAHPARWTLQ
jgi:hypothetical protein